MHMLKRTSHTTNSIVWKTLCSLFNLKQLINKLTNNCSHFTGVTGIRHISHIDGDAGAIATCSG